MDPPRKRAMRNVLLSRRVYCTTIEILPWGLNTPPELGITTVIAKQEFVEILEIRKSGNLDIRKSGFPEIWISGFPGIRKFDACCVLAPRHQWHLAK